MTITSDVKIALSTSLNGKFSIQTNANAPMTVTITSAGHPDTSVTWSVNGIKNGNSAIGSITPANAGAATYAAPATLPTPNTVAIEATSVADPSQSASVTLRIDIPIQQYYSETNSSGQATFVLSGSAAASQVPRAVIHPNTRAAFAQSSSSGTTVTIEAVDENTQTPVINIGASLFTGLNGNAVVILSDPAGRYYTRSQILQLPSTPMTSPIQVFVPPVIPPPSNSSTGTVDVDSIQVPPPPQPSTSLLTPNLNSLWDQAWESFAATFGYTIQEEDITLGNLINGQLSSQIQSELANEFSSSSRLHMYMMTFENAGEDVAAFEAADAALLSGAILQGLQQLYFSEKLTCEGYQSNQIMHVKVLVTGAASLGVAGLDDIILSVEPDGPPAGASCSGSTGSISGTAVDAQTSQLIANAAVIAEGTTLAPSGVLSAQNGAFSFPNLLTGTYWLTAKRGGYIEQQTTLQVAAGQTASVTIPLQPVPFYSIQIQTSSSTILQPPNGQTQFTAVALDASGSPVSPQPTFIWQSSNPAAATVDASGLVQAVAPGPTQITAWADDGSTENCGAGAVPVSKWP